MSALLVLLLFIASTATGDEVKSTNEVYKNWREQEAVNFDSPGESERQMIRNFQNEGKQSFLNDEVDHLLNSTREVISKENRKSFEIPNLDIVGMSCHNGTFEGHSSIYRTGNAIITSIREGQYTLRVKLAMEDLKVRFSPCTYGWVVKYPNLTGSLDYMSLSLAISMDGVGNDCKVVLDDIAISHFAPMTFHPESVIQEGFHKLITLFNYLIQYHDTLKTEILKQLHDIVRKATTIGGVNMCVISKILSFHL